MSRKDLLKLTAGSLVLTGFLLTGCSSSGYYYDRKTEYVGAKEYPAIKLPAAADAARFKQVMPLPEIAALEKLDDEFVVPRPDALPVVDEDLPPSELREFAGTEGIASRLWLSISNGPAVAWPMLQRQFEQLNWVVTAADPSTGRIRFVPDNQISAQAVSAQLRQGIRGGFSDLELLTSEGKVRTDTAAKALLSQINTGFSDLKAGSQSVSLLAQNISREKTVTLQAVSGQDPVLLLGTDADRTWVGLEILLTEQFKESQQKLLSSDAATRQFSIVWVPEAERSSILTSWASSPGPEYQYQLVLTGSSPVSIRVQQDGKVADPRKSRQILAGVRKLLN